MSVAPEPAHYFVRMYCAASLLFTFVGGMSPGFYVPIVSFQWIFLFPEEDDGVALSVIDTRRLVILTELPFVVPFEERVQVILPQVSSELLLALFELLYICIKWHPL